MPVVNYQQPVVSFLEPQWQPHVQLSSSAPASYTPDASNVEQAQPPAFYPPVSCPLSEHPVHQQLLLSQLQLLNPNSEYGMEDAKASLPLDDPCSSFTPPAPQTPQAVQEKTSMVLEPATEWTQRIAEVRKPERSNPFQSSYRSRPMLIPQIGESEPRLYHPLPVRSGVSASIGRMPAPPVGSEEDLVARLASSFLALLFFSPLMLFKGARTQESSGRKPSRVKTRKTQEEC
jgi:hypothetical protein